MEAIAVGRVIDRLVTADFVVRRADPNDRRRWCLHLTAKASAVTDDMEVLADELRQLALAGVGRAELRTFENVLDRIRGNLLALDAPLESDES
jgi:MarR family transcriptional regulator for hemolysin